MASSFWSRYKEALNVKKDLRDVFIRPHDRYATLDGVRAITVLLMVLFHVLFGVVVLLKDNFDYIDRFIAEFPRYLGWMWQSQGSDPLFVLCGLLVSYTLFREYEKTSGIQFMRFYKRRLMRIMPVFIVALLLYLPTDKDNIGHLWSNLIFMSNYIPGERHVIPVGWSLDVQLHFYFLLPFLILVMYSIPWRITFLTTLVLASFAWRYYIVARNPEIYESPFYQIIYDSEYGSLLANQLYYDLDVRIGAFFLGMLVAYLHHYHGKQIKEFLSRHMVLNTVLVLAGLGMIVASISLPIENRFADFYDTFDPQFNLLFLAFDRYVYSVGLSIVVLLALCPVGISRWVDWVLSWKIWHPVAQLIFPIYLFHFIFIVIGAVIALWTTDRESITAVTTYQVFLIFAITVVLTMAFSALVHVYVEKPFLTMRERDGVRDHSAIPNTIPTNHGGAPAVEKARV
ncbi:acyltransferase family protein [Gilvimarinus sp. F26214L]|uniref:acyltransferase family protein n=1 Tax=Gilvimarinus sp. DZF01 TaxID=3461371 RepID=UPI0040461A40